MYETDSTKRRIFPGCDDLIRVSGANVGSAMTQGGARFSSIHNSVDGHAVAITPGINMGLKFRSVVSGVSLPLGKVRSIIQSPKTQMLVSRCRIEVPATHTLHITRTCVCPPFFSQPMGVRPLL